MVRMVDVGYRIWMEAPLKTGYSIRPIQDARTGVSVDGKVLPLSTLPSAFVLFRTEGSTVIPHLSPIISSLPAR